MAGHACRPVYDLIETYTMIKKPKLTRMNLLVNRDDLQQLKDLYGVKSESEAVRRACELVLLSRQAERLVEFTMTHGGLEDVFGRTKGDHQLPHEWPEDEPIEDLDWDEEDKPAPAAPHRR